MTKFVTRRLGAKANKIAPDGSEVRFLAAAKCGGMAHFRLAAGKVSKAVRHGGVEELWFFVAGRGQMWRRRGKREETVAVAPGVSIAISPRTSFQFRAGRGAALEAVAVTMPPWPGDDEAVPVEGVWEATV